MTEQPGIDKWIISSTGYKILKRFEVFQKDEIYQITVSLKSIRYFDHSYYLISLQLCY